MRTWQFTIKFVHSIHDFTSGMQLFYVWTNDGEIIVWNFGAWWRIFIWTENQSLIGNSRFIQRPFTLKAIVRAFFIHIYTFLTRSRSLIEMFRVKWVWETLRASQHTLDGNFNMISYSSKPYSCICQCLHVFAVLNCGFWIWSAAVMAKFTIQIAFISFFSHNVCFFLWVFA